MERLMKYLKFFTFEIQFTNKKKLIKFNVKLEAFTALKKKFLIIA